MSTPEADLARVMLRDPAERDVIRILGKCDSIRTESRDMKRVCEGLRSSGVLKLSRAWYSLTAQGRAEHAALKGAGKLDNEVVWEETEDKW